MPTIYHSDDVFEKYVAEHGSMDGAKQAIKEAAKERAPEPETAADGGTSNE